MEKPALLGPLHLEQIPHHVKGTLFLCLGDLLHGGGEITNARAWGEKGMIFLQAALIRETWTVAKTAVASIGTRAMLFEVTGKIILPPTDWITVLSTSILAGLLSILTSVATDLPEAPKGI